MDDKIIYFSIESAIKEIEDMQATVYAYAKADGIQVAGKQA